MLDWGLRQFLTASACWCRRVARARGAGVAGRCRSTAFTGQLENLYGVLALLGVVRFAILGMLYKIVPFLVWYGRYSREGRAKTACRPSANSIRRDCKWPATGFTLPGWRG